MSQTFAGQTFDADVFAADSLAGGGEETPAAGGWHGILGLCLRWLAAPPGGPAFRPGEGIPVPVPFRGTAFAVPRRGTVFVVPERDA
jgi:hypothetical protein